MTGIVTGDCRMVMADMAAAGERVQCVITSPPYWGLRAYGNAACVWGGDPDCAHEWSTTAETREIRKGAGLAKLGEQYRGGGHKQGEIGHQSFERSTCSSCGAWFGELGHEPLHDCAGWATGEDCGQCYICHLREVMRGVWSVLADDGIAWINLGDTYATSGGRISDAHFRDGRNRYEGGHQKPPTGIAPPKNLMLVPQRFALAMQADGWIVRRDLIWSKPNAMPESVQDRPTTAHEYIWLLAKQSRYYYDAEAVRELGKDPKQANGARVRAPAGWDTGEGAHGSVHRDGRAREVEYREVRPGQNPRSVWTIATQPYSEAHYATFPPRLVEPMILSSTRPGDAVFDPFAGTGTVAAEAQRLGRKFVGAEINPENEHLQARRLKGPMGLGL